MNETPTSIGWALNLPSELLWRSWGDAHFVFDCRSGQTHFLNTLATEIFQMLDARPVSSDALYRAVLARHAVDEDDELREAIATSLRVLDRLGLVEWRPAAGPG